VADVHAHLFVGVMEVVGMFRTHKAMWLTAGFEHGVLDRLDAFFNIARFLPNFKIVYQVLHFLL
jgi:hypothetical protein